MLGNVPHSRNERADHLKGALAARDVSNDMTPLIEHSRLPMVDCSMSALGHQRHFALRKSCSLYRKGFSGAGQKRTSVITSVSAVFNDLAGPVVAHRTLKGALIVARAIGLEAPKPITNISLALNRSLSGVCRQPSANAFKRNTSIRHLRRKLVMTGEKRTLIK